MRIFATIDWDKLRTGVTKDAWYADIIATMQTKINEQIAQGVDIPQQSGGWIHRYISPENWMPLIYDNQSPTDHRSSLGDSYTGEPYDGAWRVWRHRELTNLARDAGLLYHITGEKQYLEASISILEQYSQQYLKFAGDWDADNWMLKGRAMNQALTEALWAYPLILAYDLVSDLMPDAETTRQNLLLPIAETLTRAHDVLINRGDMHHNYTAWLLATLGCIAFTLDDADLIARVITGEGGFEAHISAAILSDNIERESTPYYHNFVVLAYEILALAANPKYDLYAVTGTSGQSIAGMWEAFSRLALPDGTIIEANDGSYWQDSIYDLEIGEVYETAFAQTSNLTYAWLLDKAYQRRGVPRHGWTALLFANAELTYDTPQLEARILTDSGFALLHNDTWSISVPFGDYAGEHSHLDRMSLNIYPFSLDAGTPLYGIEERKTWYKQTLAHNTMVVDAQSQDKGSADCVRFSNEQMTLQSSSLYEGVILERDIQLGDVISDVFTAKSDEVHQYDLLFHSDSEWHIGDAVPQSLDTLYAEDGAGQYVKIFAELACESELVVESTVKNQTYRLKLSADQPFQLLLARCIGQSHAPYLQRYMLIARVNAKSVAYQSEISLK
ncbi:MAG: hypothetical protein Phog2KO_46210 [Phototrophicaceae bacterium]